MTIVSFLDHGIASFLAHFLHSTKDDLQLVWVQSVEHKCLVKPFVKGFEDRVRFRVEWRLKVFFFVPLAESFGRNARSRSTLDNRLWLYNLMNFLVFL